MSISLHRRSFLLAGAGAGALAMASRLGITRAHAANDGPLRVRRNISTMKPDDPYFADYAEAVKAMHELSQEEDTRSWRQQSLIHINHCPHGRPDFAAWHRQYLVYFERICGALIGKPEFALGYWDWTTNSGRLPGAFFAAGPLNVTFWNDPSDAQSDNWGPYEVTTVGTRNLTPTFGLQDDPVRGGAFTAQTISSIQRIPAFSPYQTALEGTPHNSGHVVTGTPNGHMIDGMSPLDPAFWMHHGNVDRLWAEWQAAGNTTPSQPQVYNDQFYDTDGKPVANVTAQSGVDFRSLGYTYDTLTDMAMREVSSTFQLPEEKNQSALSGIAAPRLEPDVLSTVSADETARLNVAVDIPVAVPELVSVLFRSRTYRPTFGFGEKRLAVESGRIYARLVDVEPNAAATKLLTNVFVNCPYLSPQTPYSDANYAGSFAFFGMAMPRTFVIDITDPIRTQAGQGRISTDNIKVQLMPVASTGAEKDAEEASYKVGKIEIFAI
ncbi:tyrosinase family protein [Breoghania sp. JC706]|uniref:tyrosinase family protein n=1 Tax=Breoghania sp. JC706 TaxID=3117732 RepID=UPI003008FFB8